MKQIKCVQCHKGIVRKRDLRILATSLQPVHGQCLDQPRNAMDKAARISGTFPMGLTFWLWLLIGNVCFYGVAMNEPQSVMAIGAFAIICNLIFIIPRLIIYQAIERHLN